MCSLPTCGDHFRQLQRLPYDAFQHGALGSARRAVFRDDLHLVSHHIAAFQIGQVQRFAGVALDEKGPQFLLRTLLTGDRDAVLLFVLLSGSDGVHLSRKRAQNQVGADEKNRCRYGHGVHPRAGQNADGSRTPEGSGGVHSSHRAAVLKNDTAAQKAHAGNNAASHTEHLIGAVQHGEQGEKAGAHADQNIDANARRVPGQLPFQPDEKPQHHGEGNSQNKIHVEHSAHLLPTPLEYKNRKEDPMAKALRFPCD